MDDNGGQLSSPCVAMESRPLPDQGRIEVIYPMEDIIVEDSEGGRSLTMRNDGLQASDGSDNRNLLDECERLTGNGGFSQQQLVLYSHWV